MADDPKKAFQRTRMAPAVSHEKDEIHQMDKPKTYMERKSMRPLGENAALGAAPKLSRSAVKRALGGKR